MSDFQARIVRTLIQVVAGGLLMMIVNQVVLDFPGQYVPYLVMAGGALTAGAQNIAEEKGWIPIILKPAGSQNEKVV